MCDLCKMLMAYDSQDRSVRIQRYVVYLNFGVCSGVFFFLKELKSFFLCRNVFLAFQEVVWELVVSWRLVVSWEMFARSKR